MNGRTIELSGQKDETNGSSVPVKRSFRYAHLQWTRRYGYTALPLGESVQHSRRLWKFNRVEHFEIVIKASLLVHLVSQIRFETQSQCLLWTKPNTCIAPAGSSALPSQPSLINICTSNQTDLAESPYRSSQVWVSRSHGADGHQAMGQNPAVEPYWKLLHMFARFL